MLKNCWTATLPIRWNWLELNSFQLDWLGLNTIFEIKVPENRSLGNSNCKVGCAVSGFCNKLLSNHILYSLNTTLNKTFWVPNPLKFYFYWRRKKKTEVFVARADIESVMLLSGFTQTLFERTSRRLLWVNMTTECTRFLGHTKTLGGDELHCSHSCPNLTEAELPCTGTTSVLPKDSWDGWNRGLNQQPTSYRTTPNHSATAAPFRPKMST